VSPHLPADSTASLGIVQQLLSHPTGRHLFAKPFNALTPCFIYSYILSGARLAPLFDQIGLLVNTASLLVIRTRWNHNPTIVVHPPLQQQINAKLRQRCYSPVAQFLWLYQIELIEERRLTPPRACQSRHQRWQRHEFSVPSPVLLFQGLMLPDLCHQQLWDQGRTIGSHCAWMLQNHDVLNLCLAKSSHFYFLKYITRKKGPCAIDLIPSSTIKQSP